MSKLPLPRLGDIAESAEAIAAVKAAILIEGQRMSKRFDIVTIGQNEVGLLGAWILEKMIAEEFGAQVEPEFFAKLAGAIYALNNTSAIRQAVFGKKAAEKATATESITAAYAAMASQE